MLRFVIFYLCAFFSIYAIASDAQEQLQNHLSGLKTMKANFKQVIVDENNLPIQNSSGNMVLKRPGYFRWYTHQPNRQILIVNRQKLWIYDIDLAQMTINDIDTRQGSTPAVLLSDDTQRVVDLYKVSVKSTKSLDAHWFTLIPLSNEENYQWMKLSFKNSQLLKIELKDRMGQITKIQFSQIVLNKPVKNSLFQLESVSNVDIIDNTLKEI